MLGHRLDDTKKKQAIREADPGSTGELQFEQFAVYASRYVEVEEDVQAVAKELREAFLLYDRDGEYRQYCPPPFWLLVEWNVLCMWS